MGSKNKTISFRVVEDKFESLQDISGELGESVTGLVRPYTDQFVESWEALKDDSEVGGAASYILGSMESHFESLRQSRLYRDFHSQLQDEEAGADSFDEFVEDYARQNNLGELGYIEGGEEPFLSTVDHEYDDFEEVFFEVTDLARDGEYDQAREIIQEIEEEGNRLEAQKLGEVVMVYEKL